MPILLKIPIFYKYFLFTIVLFLVVPISFAQPKFSEMSVRPGAFSRMGFGARGIGFGNGLSALTDGNLVAYYNPAASVFQSGNSFQTGYSLLSLNRTLNFLSFTRRFEFFSIKDTTSDNYLRNSFKKPSSIAGLSAGIINSGVSKIDGRDNNGLKTKELSTSENLFFISVANKFSERLALGLSVKFYYYKLYEKITTTGVGFDIGAIYKLTDNLNLSIMFADLNSKYKWDSGPVYGHNGLTTENKFPLLKKLGIFYKNSEYKFIIVGELESSNAGTDIIKLGSEYNIIQNFYIRAGVDQLNLSNSDWPVRPSFGFSYSHKINDYIVGFDYAFMIEPYSNDRHIIGVNFNF